MVCARHYKVDGETEARTISLSNTVSRLGMDFFANQVGFGIILFTLPNLINSKCGLLDIVKDVFAVAFIARMDQSRSDTPEISIVSTLEEDEDDEVALRAAEQSLPSGGAQPSDVPSAPHP